MGYGTGALWDLGNSTIDSKSALVQVMAWHPIGDKPLLELAIPKFIDPYAEGHYGATMPVVKGHHVT